MTGEQSQAIEAAILSGFDTTYTRPMANVRDAVAKAGLKVPERVLQYIIRDMAARKIASVRSADGTLELLVPPEATNMVL